MKVTVDHNGTVTEFDSEADEATDKPELRAAKDVKDWRKNDRKKRGSKKGSAGA